MTGTHGRDRPVLADDGGVGLRPDLSHSSILEQSRGSKRGSSSHIAVQSFQDSTRLNDTKALYMTLPFGNAVVSNLTSWTAISGPKLATNLFRRSWKMSCSCELISLNSIFKL
jgi:hypothetical protein